MACGHMFNFMEMTVKQEMFRVCKQLNIVYIM